MEQPFKGLDDVAVLLRSLQGERPPSGKTGWGVLRDSIPAGWIQLTERCWDMDPRRRPTCVDGILPNLRQMHHSTISSDTTQNEEDSVSVDGGGTSEPNSDCDDCSDWSGSGDELGTQSWGTFTSHSSSSSTTSTVGDETEMELMLDGTFLVEHHSRHRDGMRCAKLGTLPCTLHEVRETGKTAAVISSPFGRRSLGVEDLQTLCMLRCHPNSLHMYGLIRPHETSSSRPARLVMEYASYRTLREANPDLTEQQRLFIFLDIAAWVHFIHDRGIIWRGCQSAEILVTAEESTAKMFGFQWLRQLGSSGAAITRCGIPAFAAPEVLRGEPYGMSADIYSMGIVFWEILVGVLPYSQASLPMIDIMQAILDGARPDAFCEATFDTGWRVPMLHLIKRMWDSEASARPSSEEVLEEVLRIAADSTAIRQTADVRCKRMDIIQEQMELSCTFGRGSNLIELWSTLVHDLGR